MPHCYNLAEWFGQGPDKLDEGLNRPGLSRSYVHVGLNQKCDSCVKYESGSNTCIVGGQPESCGKLYEPLAGDGCCWRGPFPGGRLTSEPATVPEDVIAGKSFDMRSHVDWERFCSDEDVRLAKSHAEPVVEITKQLDLTDDEARLYAEAKIDSALDSTYRMVSMRLRWKCPMHKDRGIDASSPSFCPPDVALDAEGCICKDIPLGAVAHGAYNDVVYYSLGNDKNFLRGWRMIKPTVAIFLARLALIKPALDASPG